MNKLKALGIVIFTIFSIITFAQDTITIGTATTSQTLMPIDYAIGYSVCEMIYLQNEVGYPGMIGKLAFCKDSGLTSSLSPTVTVYMKHTTDTLLTTGTTSTTGYTQVWAGQFTNDLSSGWMEIAFDQVFNYNNIDNLQILITKGYNSGYLGAPAYRYTSTSPNTLSRYYTDNLKAWSSSSTLISSTARPNIRLEILPFEELELDYDIINIEDSSQYGSITIVPEGGMSPYSYLWYPELERPSFSEFSATFDSIPDLDSLPINIETIYNDIIGQYTGNSLTGLQPGHYSCMVTDALGDTVSFNGTVYANAFFSNNEGFIFEDGNIVNTDTITRDTISAIIGVKFSIEEKSEISFEIGQDSLSAIFGLSLDALATTGDSLFNDEYSIDCGFIFEDNIVWVINSGKAEETDLEVTAGEIVKIKSNEDQILLMVDDVLVESVIFPPKSIAAPVFSSSSSGIVFSNLFLQASSSRSVTATVNNSYCNLPSLSSISFEQEGYNSVSYSWTGPDNFISTESENYNLDPGLYDITMYVNYGTPPLSISYSQMRSFIVGDYINWVTSDLELEPVNRLTSNSFNMDDPDINNAISLNKVEIYPGDEHWVTYKLNFNESFEESFDFLVIGLTEEDNTNASQFPLQSGVAILNMNDGDGIFTDATYLYEIENGVIINGNNPVNIPSDVSICFKIVNDYITVYTLANDHLEYIYEYNNFDETGIFNAYALICTEGTSIEESISTFCYTEKCYYHVPKKTIDGGYATTINGKLRFKYDEEYFVGNSGNLDYKIYEYEGGAQINIGNGIVKYGDNRYAFEYGSNLTNDKIYILEITNSKEEKRFLKFKVTNSNTCDCED